MFLHYYYGNREESANIAIGTAIRAIGHEFNVTIIAINYYNEGLIDYMSKVFKPLLIKVDLINIDPPSVYRMIEDRYATFSSTSDKHLLVVLNFDLLYKKDPKAVEKLTQLLLDTHNQTCEIILTGEQRIVEIEDKADYLSEISKRSNKFNVNSKMTNSRSD